MKIQGRGILLPVALLLMTSFQNCSQKGSIALESKPPVEDTDVTPANTDPVEPCLRCGFSPDGKSLIFKATDEAVQLPPLKLFFIVDNSISMLESQLSLANSFKTLFDSSSGQNLSKFDGEIYIFTTSMLNSVYLNSFGDNIPARDPISTMAKMSFADLFKLRSPAVTGEIPGDMAGHIVLSKAIEGGGSLRQSFISPVHGLREGANGSAILAPSILFKKGGSLAELQADFQKRVALLDPAKFSDPDQGNNVTAGESALCGLARLLRDPGPYIKQGEHLSFVVVSDENDTNPEGFRCVRTVKYDSNNLWTDFEYIAGNSVTGPAVDLKTYVKNRLGELLGGDKANFSFFVRLEGDSLGEGGSTGTEYINFGKSVGAQMNSVLMPSYSSALQNLSAMIKSTVKMSYVLDIPAPVTIKNLYRSNTKTGGFDLVATSLWSSQGATITLNPELGVKNTDEFKVEF